MNELRCYKPQIKSLQQHSSVINRTVSTKVAIMIEVTSRHVECSLLTPDFSQTPAVALHGHKLDHLLTLALIAWKVSS